MLPLNNVTKIFAVGTNSGAINIALRQVSENTCNVCFDISYSGITENRDTIEMYLDRDDMLHNFSTLLKEVSAYLDANTGKVQ